MLSPLFTIQLAVRFGECDPAGIAFYPRYFEWIDVAATELHKLLGITRIGVHRPLGLPVAAASAEFVAPAHAEDELSIRVYVQKLGRTSFSLRFDFVRNADGALLARATERRVLVVRNPDGTMNSTALTPGMRAVLQRFREDSE